VDGVREGSKNLLCGKVVYRKELNGRNRQKKGDRRGQDQEKERGDKEENRSGHGEVCAHRKRGEKHLRGQRKVFRKPREKLARKTTVGEKKNSLEKKESWNETDATEKTMRHTCATRCGFPREKLRGRRTGAMGSDMFLGRKKISGIRRKCVDVVKPKRLTLSRKKKKDGKEFNQKRGGRRICEVGTGRSEGSGEFRGHMQKKVGCSYAGFQPRERKVAIRMPDGRGGALWPSEMC